ncbi:MAG: hypothetical protein J3R72DRAFT_464897 [Linnemannia gamsii]|nr:MAG: hypothetical protein J3R72DRAFT_464897 [Linnemannia gamsii]
MHCFFRRERDTHTAESRKIHPCFCSAQHAPSLSPLFIFFSLLSCSFLISITHQPCQLLPPGLFDPSSLYASSFLVAVFTAVLFFLSFSHSPL